MSNRFVTASVTEYLSQMTVGPSAVDRLVKAAAQGQTDEVQDILAQSPDIVSIWYDGYWDYGDVLNMSFFV